MQRQQTCHSSVWLSDITDNHVQYSILSSTAGRTETFWIGSYSCLCLFQHHESLSSILQAQPLHIAVTVPETHLHLTRTLTRTPAQRLGSMCDPHVQCTFQQPQQQWTSPFCHSHCGSPTHRPSSHSYRLTHTDYTPKFTPEPHNNGCAVETIDGQWGSKRLLKTKTLKLCLFILWRICEATYPSPRTTPAHVSYPSPKRELPQPLERFEKGWETFWILPQPIVFHMKWWD